ncbi:MAG: hypothetical protein KAR35_03820, partial [Candidatus Heimdallarchaeota archaeon]|nr:hypothetical protein [Candidatus Heimdallarchaeota archaeon]MCK5048482.1 hypothetical protein [Candidatus Heimdallarchaeota archaeon]
MKEMFGKAWEQPFGKKNLKLCFVFWGTCVAVIIAMRITAYNDWDELGERLFFVLFMLAFF